MKSLIIPIVGAIQFDFTASKAIALLRVTDRSNISFLLMAMSAALVVAGRSLHLRHWQ